MLVLQGCHCGVPAHARQGADKVFPGEEAGEAERGVTVSGPAGTCGGPLMLQLLRIHIASKRPVVVGTT
jgi:hypothetical protein